MPTEFWEYMMTSILLADENHLVRKGLKSIIEAGPGMHVVAEAWDGHSAVAQARQTLPDVALIDIVMPGMDGLQATRELLRLARPPRILVLTRVGGAEYVDGAIHAGAHGFVLKDSEPEELLTHIRRVADGASVLDPAVTAGLFDRYTRPEPQPGPVDAAARAAVSELPEREQEMLQLLCYGHSNAAIARRMDLTAAAVKGQLSRLMAHFAVTNRVQLARIAYHAGLDGGA
ncbi:response regulator [Streptomyces sp. IBSNAI002]|uniref:response regulator n=1 Tax=Streptomyces sp. IBSNAI002 TaxID=3457500 RepID=UPI003FD5E3AE